MNFKIRLLICFAFFFLLQSFSAQAKYVDGKVYLLDGKEIDCIIDLPIRAASNKVTIKDNHDSKSRTISSNDIDMIVLSSNEASVVLKQTQIMTIKLKGTKTSKGKVWLEITHFCENVILYQGIAGYDVDRKGNLLGLFVDGMGAHYLQRSGESNPTEVGFVFTTKQITQKAIDKQRKQKLERYFSNDKKALVFLDAKKRVTAAEVVEYIESICVEIKG